MTLRELIQSVDSEQYSESPLYQKLRETKPEYGSNKRIQVKCFDDEFITFLLKLKWWDWDIEKIERNFKALSSGDLSLIKKIDK